MVIRGTFFRKDTETGNFVGIEIFVSGYQWRVVDFLQTTLSGGTVNRGWTPYLRTWLRVPTSTHLPRSVREKLPFSNTNPVLSPIYIK